MKSYNIIKGCKKVKTAYDSFADSRRRTLFALFITISVIPATIVLLGITFGAVVYVLIRITFDLLKSIFLYLMRPFSHTKPPSLQELRSRIGLLRRKRIVNNAPGTKLLSVAVFLYSPKSVELTFKPLITDLRVEYYDALQQGQEWKARWIRVRYFHGFIAAMGLHKVYALIGSFTSTTK